jgi:hypothetical protein
MKRYIVELEPGVWISHGANRTLRECNAKRYRREQDAAGALTRARTRHVHRGQFGISFQGARIVEVKG